jgi:hypothetical protein
LGHGQLDVWAFSHDSLVECLGDAPAVQYLSGYLCELRATVCLCESPYVDRHFLDEFASYYARSFRPPTSACRRLHFFASFTVDALNATVDQLMSGDLAHDMAERAFSAAYLGFLVIRPLDGAKIGRTVLKTYPQMDRRHYTVTRPYRVNLLGMALRIDGLAYQQQDRGAAVCASTSLWSALQRIAFVAGNRTPTPHEVTVAARSPYPASAGLDDAGMAAALCGLGYIADSFAPAENRALFRALVATCLMSGLPVILLLSKKHQTGAGERRVGHAVVVTGFCRPDSVVEVPCDHPDVPPLRMTGGSLATVYVHDDNLGSHAHYEILDADEFDESGHARLLLRRGRTGATSQDWWTVDDWSIEGALIPKPPKLRLPVDELIWGVLEARRVLEKVLAPIPLHFSAHITSGVEYRRGLLVPDRLHRPSLREFMTNLALPRQVGVISLWTDGVLLLDCLVDVTEVARNPDTPSWLGLVAFGVPFDTAEAVNLAAVADVFGIPFIAAA